MNWNSDQIELVENRIALIKQLTKAREHFKGHEKIKVLPSHSWTHPYKDYAALRIYLALTCFDILGQPSEWKDFNSWLRSKKQKEIRDRIIQKHSSLDQNELILNVHNEYLKIYGVKNSFYRFIREVISEDQKQKLFNSIMTSQQISPLRITDKGIKGPSSKEVKLNLEFKEKFLFKIRNSFTHKGISIASPAGGIFDDEKPFPVGPKMELRWGYNLIHEERLKDEIIYFSVSRWPFVLIEIIEETLKIIQ